MIDYRKEFDEAILRINTYTNGDDNRQKEYLPEVFLYPREMHVLELIFDNEDVNTTGLSRLSGFPKGTISKMMKKLGDMSLVEIYKHDDNSKEVHYKLTELGVKAHNAHTEYHKVYGREFYESFDLLPERAKSVIVSTLNEYANYMRSYTMGNPVDLAGDDNTETQEYEDENNSN